VTPAVVPGSFRDPHGVVFRTANGVVRQVNKSYREHYDRLIASGLYAALVSAKLLVPHEELATAGLLPGAYKVIKPRHVEFISYPYEWSFGQLKAAALTTLEIQTQALDFGMSLRDASAYNIQFVEGRATLIDTLSFETITPGEPWVAYRQFCEHFLAPLALIALRDHQLSRLLTIHLDGIPLELAVTLLPFRARLRPSLLLHLYAHARSQRRWKSRAAPATGGASFGDLAFRGLVASLRRAVSNLRWRRYATTWTGYYDEATSYSDQALAHKRAAVAKFIDEVRPRVVWDLGANTGAFSRLATERGCLTIAFDGDAACVETMQNAVAAGAEPRLLPLVTDITNPSPGLGWAHRERESLLTRGPADLVMALALIHHLAIGNNVPLALIVELLADVGRFAILEFVPRHDAQARRLLASRRHDFPDYEEGRLEDALAARFVTLQRVPIADSTRTLYLLQRRSR
jgi:ribosomal protein L11 methylase PrmA